MTLIQALILGIVQGLTEFLPISSSAHLVILPFLMNWSIPESQVFPFDVLVQIGTLVAVVVYFWKDIWLILKAFVLGLIHKKPFEDVNARLGWYLILATIPAGFAGVFLKSKVEEAFNSPRITAYFLFGTAVLLLAAEFFSRRNRKLTSIKWLDALWIGVFQAISIFPGISRSGSTITGGMTRDFDRPSAARFSFLMSIPVFVAAGAMSISDLTKIPDLGSFLPVLIAGFLAAMVVGYLSIHWLLSFLKKRSLIYFAAYCVLLAVAVLITGYVRGKSVSNQPIQAQAPISSPTDLPLSTADSEDAIIVVEYTASLDWLMPQMTTCANDTQGVSIVTHLVSGDQSYPSEGAILLRWGQPVELSTFSANLGTNQLVMLVNPKNPLKKLPRELIQKLAEGKFNTWTEVFQECPECFENVPGAELSSQVPTLNFYLSGEEAQDLFERVVMDKSSVALASATLIPSSLSMREAILSSPSAIGFIPSGAVDDSVKKFDIAGMDASQLTMPILAVSNAEPQGTTRAWLVCLQRSL